MTSEHHVMEYKDLHTDDLEKLTEIFREAGASAPELWASSQIEFGTNQLGTFSFLKSITGGWLKEEETEWIDNQIQYDYSTPGEPDSQLSALLKELLEKKVSRETIIDFIRVIQYDTLASVCGTIDGYIQAETPVSNWALYERDENHNPKEQISGSLLECLLEFDPSGKEMKPRNKDTNP